MILINKILDFFLFRRSFTIETELDPTELKKIIPQFLKRRPGIINAVFLNHKFAFGYQKFLPSVYNFDVFVFNGNIYKSDDKTSIRIKSNAPIIFICFIYLLVGVFYVDYFIGIFPQDSFNEALPEKNIQLFSALFLVLVYGIYCIKYSDVKFLFKSLIKKEEKRALTL